MAVDEARKYDASEKRGFAQLRRLMVEPDSVYIMTAANGRRYLTDKYVMLDITNSRVVGWDLLDGEYSLRATLGLRRLHKAVPVVPDVNGYFRMVEGGHPVWVATHATAWSLRGDHARLMWGEYGQAQHKPGHPRRFACAINADALDAFSQAYKGEGSELVFEKDARRLHRPFRVRLVEPMPHGPRSRVLGYVMGIRIPHHDMPTALLIVRNQRGIQDA